ncbi:MAG: peptidoglycan recognition family protein [Patescibacteria group bacterium]
MSSYFDKAKWSQILQKPNWPSLIYPEIERFKKETSQKGERELCEFKNDLRIFIGEKIENREIFLVGEGPDRDRWRKPIDTVVIHHTQRSPGYTWQRLSVVQLLNIYVPVFATDPIKRKEPIYSHHFREGSQVFYAYHWLVRMDGSAERLLEDHQIGWHAGVWKINCRSIGICLDNNYMNSSPSKGVIESVAELINRNYPKIKKKRIFGHREVNLKVTCPGDEFLPCWKKDLLSYLG